MTLQKHADGIGHLIHISGDSGDPGVMLGVK